MSKTYSVAIKNQKGHWITNYDQYASPDDINWENVETHCKETGALAYGYYYGHNSRNLTSARCRTVKMEWPVEAKELVND